MKLQSKRTTQKDIARRAQLSVAAVSMALKNHPSLPSDTIERVQAIAKELNYAPDPVLSALVAHRNGMRSSKSFSAIGLLSNWARPEEWTRLESAREILRGIEERAAELGYSIQHYCTHSDEARLARVGTVMKTRGIRGLILAPLEHNDDDFEIDSDSFSIVTIGTPTKYRYFHHVTQNQFANVQLCWEKLRQRGYRRVGLVVREELANRWSHQWEAAHNYERSQYGAARDEVSTLYLKSDDPLMRLREWLRKEKPDAVICRCNRFFEAASSEGIRIPEDIGYVSLNVADDAPEASGIDQHREEMGAIAMDSLNTLLQKNQRGEQRISTGTLVDGSWKEGKTLPSKMRAN